MKRSWFNVRAQTADRLDVDIRGPIGEWGETDRSLIERIEAAGEIQVIGLTINSRGGEVDHAVSIYNILRKHPARIEVTIDGVAASAASIIAMAGDHIIMPANALMMLHSPWVYAAGNARDLEKAAEDLRKFEHALIETYMTRGQKSAEEIRAILEAETWMTAAEAVAMGFADEVQSISRRAAVAMAEAVGIPDSVLARLDAVEHVPAPPPGAEDHDNPEDSERTAEVHALCTAAARPDLCAALLPLARASGIESVRAILNDMSKPSGVHSFNPGVDHNPELTQATALARLGLRAINPRLKI